ncbi:Mov34/MPN/PAD-1 family protein isoform 3 [Theobroma cacao]|uniref:Mov34/MPN/PAD-1 family protein isoform 3 n=1 Tax=Theobroma cacao TaxID=3641 RepID=A0A061GAD8_THECC|nr:Mov34/MPN/PAD-1 family protein isoform 3 [Theobroma cacao]
MSLTCVKMSEDVWLTCLTHALSTETEEIMGLLLGDIEYSKDGNVTALIWGASPQSRSDRRKDRVETNPEQLAAASAQADRMTASTGRTTRVIGWYHSHPHITVLPSHVDVRTQAMYQLLDSGFIGLIFSCFSEDTNKVGRIQVIAFQSSDGKQSHASGPVALSPVNRSSVIDLESSLSSSENPLVTLGSAKVDSPLQDTGDSRLTLVSSKGGGRSVDLGGFFANADANYLGREQSEGNYNASNIQNAVVDIDPMDMSESMQEAMHRSNMDMRDGKVHPLSFIHHTSTYQASMCKLIEYCLSPAINALQDRLKENEIRVQNETELFGIAGSPNFNIAQIKVTFSVRLAYLSYFWTFPYYELQTPCTNFVRELSC